jgi:hypothetical protein
MTTLRVILGADDLLVVGSFLERFAQWAITKVIPRHENLGWIRVTSLLELGNLILGEKLDTQDREDVTDIDHEKTALECSKVLTATLHILGHDIVDGEVGGDKDTKTYDLWGLVLLVDWVTGLIADALEKLDTKAFHRVVIHVLKQNMRVHIDIEAVEEFGVEVLVEVLGIDELHESGLARSWSSKQPDMRVAIGLEVITTLVKDALELFTVDKKVAWKLFECLVVFATFNHVLHLDDNVIKLAFLFLFRAFLDLGGRVRFVLWTGTMLEQCDGIRIELAFLLLVMRDPSRIRESPVARDQVITEILFDLEILQNRTLRHSIDEHDGDVHVADKVIRLIRLCSDFDPGHENVTELSRLRFGLEACFQEIHIRVRWHIEPTIPFAIDRMERNVGLNHLGGTLVELEESLLLFAGKMRNENLVWIPGEEYRMYPTR